MDPNPYMTPVGDTASQMMPQMVGGYYDGPMMDQQQMPQQVAMSTMPLMSHTPQQGWPDWAKDMLLIVLIVAIFGYSGSRDFLSSWIPMLKDGDDGKQTMTGLVAFAVLVGGAVVLFKKFVLRNQQ
jgi:hypothetical protein